MSKVNNDLIDAAELTLAMYADTQSGRAAIDERGNSIWEWCLDSGEYGRDISNTQLNRIIALTLSLLKKTAEVRTISDTWIYQTERRQP